MKLLVQRKDAERLLKGKDGEPHATAEKALDILLEVDPAERGKTIDALDDQAFANLLTRVPEADRDRFAALVEASQNPHRKLKLWKEFHVATARNDLDSRKPGDKDAYDRRKRGVDETVKEAGREEDYLLAKESRGTLTLADVDDMRHRKDLELQVEMKHNVNMTADKNLRPLPDDPSDVTPEDDFRVKWSMDEIRGVEASLSQMPPSHTDGAGNTPDELKRMAATGPVDTRSGEYHRDRIEFYDGAATPKPKSAELDVGAPRQLASPETNARFGTDIGTVEYAVTHEYGHAFADENREIFEKFEQAAGWQTMRARDLKAAGVTPKQIAHLDALNQGTADPAKGGETIVNGKLYRPYAKGEYQVIDSAAIPSESDIGSKRWNYARGNAQEHFAEMYAKAIHVPETLYRDFVQTPTAAAVAARSKIVDQKRALELLRADPSPDAQQRIAALQLSLQGLEAQAEAAEKTKRTRRAEFDVMRTDVFETPDAVRAAVQRLRQRHISEAAIKTFEMDAERVSTPQQVGMLEGQVR